MCSKCLPWSRHLAVNPTGMIRLPVRFGNKIKSKILEVDFLVVDVPTVYNVILGRPTLHKTRRGGGLRIGLSAILMLLLLKSPDLGFQEVGGPIPSILPLGRRMDKLHLLRVMALNGGPLTLIHVVEPSFLAWAASAPAFPADAVAPINLQLFAAPLVPREEPSQPSAFRNIPHPSSEDLGHGYLFLSHLRGIRSPRSCQVPGLNYVLDKRELGGRVCLDEVGRGPPGDWGGTTGSLGRGPCSFRRSEVLLHGGDAVP
ncbi:hypothetical protein Cgig2_015823 [Carnegiea gigantea]|uniref:Uncharacterized protein n=1 Tax=Carnegiea gigantea TaxID=171969 RepID=A0A9Q1KIH5_9CARY|nr:hypothetical protein Cgig2_015823 [Carnegiea gigantea]